MCRVVHGVGTWLRSLIAIRPALIWAILAFTTHWWYGSMSARRGKRLMSNPVIGAKMMWLSGKAWWKFVSPSFSRPRTCSVISPMVVNLRDVVPVVGSSCSMSETPGHMIIVSWGHDMA